MHLDQHLVAGDLGLADVPELERIRRAVGVLDDRLHGLLLGPTAYGRNLKLVIVFKKQCTLIAWWSGAS
jgi:hypothetical protein